MYNKMSLAPQNASSEPVSQNFFCGQFSKGTPEYVIIGISSVLYLILFVFGVIIFVRSAQTFRKQLSADLPGAVSRKGWKIRLAITGLLSATLLLRLPWNILNLGFGSAAYTAFWLIGRLAAASEYFISQTDICRISSGLNTPNWTCFTLRSGAEESF
eukprot:TRINITY_DN2336_c0_g2_i5.p1 TRINITY_DN2336_c0_g2~~TRINITY_DN2336_c0_g2_i5.p1  ORF type:complete len:158 (+),score=8.92 TRINITY_DN2336_c0_g2_i5:586-1059(+)